MTICVGKYFEFQSRLKGLGLTAQYVLRLKTKMGFVGIKVYIKQAISQYCILETLFSNSNLSRINQHQNITLLPYLKAKTNEIY